MELLNVFKKFLKQTSNNVVDLGNNYYKIDDVDYRFIISHKEKFKDPDAHGLLTSNLETLLKSNENVVYFVVEKGTKIAYYNSIKKLMELGSFKSPNGNITLFYLSSFKKFEAKEPDLF